MTMCELDGGRFAPMRSNRPGARWRSTLGLVLLATVGVIGSGVPASGDVVPPVAQTITAGVSAPTVRVGWPVYVVGHVDPAGMTSQVVVQRAIDKKWVDRVTSGPLAADGSFSIKITPSDVGTYSLRVRSAGGTVASPRFTLAVTPAPTISAAISTSSISIGSPVTVSGKVSPARATSQVVLQRLVGGRWLDRGAVGVNSSTGAYSILTHPSDYANYTMRVRSAGGTVVSKSVAVSTFYKAFTMVDSGDAYKGEKVVSLTFDDGPHPTYTPQMLDVLAKYKVKATFFVVGYEVKAHPELVKRMIKEGHRVGSHSYDHPQLTKLSSSAVRSQLQRTDDLIRSAGTTSRCIRPPYGDQNLRIQQIIAEFHSSTLLWDVAPDDWTRPGTSVIVSRVMSHLHPGAIIGLHDGGGPRSQTVAAIDQLIPAIQRAGYKIRPIC